MSKIRNRVAWIQTKARGAATHRREEGLKVPLYLRLLASDKYRHLVGRIISHPNKAVEQTTDVSLNPLPIVARPRSASLNVVFDHFDETSLDAFGLMIVAFAGQWSDRLGVPLRLVTRARPGDRDLLSHLIRINGLDSEKVSLAYAAADLSEGPIATTSNDLFVTSSWQTTVSAMATTPPRRLVYFMQSNEAIYYSEKTLPTKLTDVFADSDIRKIVGGAWLSETLAQRGLQLGAKSSVTFDPRYDLLLAQVLGGNPSRRKLLIVGGGFTTKSPNMDISVILEAVDQLKRADLLPRKEWEVLATPNVISAGNNFDFSDGSMLQRAVIGGEVPPSGRLMRPDIVVVTGEESMAMPLVASLNAAGLSTVLSPLVPTPRSAGNRDLHRHRTQSAKLAAALETELSEFHEPAVELERTGQLWQQDWQQSVQPLFNFLDDEMTNG